MKKFSIGLILLFVSCLFATNASATTYQQLEDRWLDVFGAGNDYNLLLISLGNTYDQAKSVRDDVTSKFDAEFDCENYTDIGDEIQDLLGQMEGIHDQLVAAEIYNAYLIDNLIYWQGIIKPSLDPGYYTPYYNVLGNFLSQINAKIYYLNNHITSAEATLDAWQQLKAELDVLTPCDELEGDSEE